MGCESTPSLIDDFAEAFVHYWATRGYLLKLVENMVINIIIEHIYYIVNNTSFHAFNSI